MTPTARPPRTVGLYLAVVQFFLVLGWVVYAAYLPQLAQKAGIALKWVPWLLLADQLVFLLTDLWVGMASDRAARVLGRLGRAVLAATLLSTAAFVLLPWVAPQGSPVLFMAVTLVWAASSSALRAPPLTLLGRYVAKPALPMTIALSSFGLGLASAAAPYVALQLKGLDPTWPFVISGLGLAAVTLGMVAAERALARQAAAAVSTPVSAAAAAFSRSNAVAFVLACAVGAAAFQWHSFVASAPLALQFAKPADLPWLLPVFWAGFNLALVPAGLLAKRWGALRTMAVGAVLAAVGNAAASLALTLDGLLVAQALAGTGWALLLCSAFCAALALGQGGREGLMCGFLQATLAGAALLRMGYLASTTPSPAVVLHWVWLAALGFALCAGLLAWRGKGQGRI